MQQLNGLRLRVLAVVVGALFAVLLGRLWYLQVLSTQDFTRVAQSNQRRSVQLTPTRGRILDRTGLPLATNLASTVITVDRKLITGKRRASDRALLFERVAQVIESDAAAVTTRAATFEARYNDQQYQELDALPLAEGITDTQAIYLRERPEVFPGLDVREAQIRAYPYGSLAAHVVGYVGRITAESKNRYVAKNYQLSDLVGVTGIEQIYEDDLRGVPGKVVFEVDSSNRVISKLSEVAAIPGSDVVLTIDATVQQLAEQALDAELRIRRTEHPRLSAAEQAKGLSVDATFSAPGGSVVVQEPADGSILAMASNPAFDLRELAGGITTERAAKLYCPDEAQTAGLCTEEDKLRAPFLNRAIQGLYPPGSTFKLVTATASLSTRLVSSGHEIDDTGTFVLKDCKSGERCRWQNAGATANGPINIIDALTRSSDVYFYQLGADFWTAKDRFGLAIQDTAERMGFGDLSGVQLPGEQEGYVPTPDRKRARHDANAAAFPEGAYPIGDNINVAVGQGDLLATPLQLANAYSIFANGGHVLSPNVVRAVTAPAVSDDQLGATVRSVGVRELREKLAMPAAVRDPILRGLRGVTASPSGTAYQSFIGFPLDQFRIAGKTGTAQTGSRNFSVDDISLFVGFAPVDIPRYTIAVVMEKSGFGAQAAAPVARLLFEALSGSGTCLPAAVVAIPELVAGSPAESSGALPESCQLYQPGDGYVE
jgi:penicillin-binding protein 2